MKGEIVPFDGRSAVMTALPPQPPPPRLLAIIDGVTGRLFDLVDAMAHMEPEALFGASAKAAKAGAALFVIAGWGFARLRDAAPHGSAWYAQQAALHDTSKSTIYRAIDAYEALMACPDGLVTIAGKLGPTKLSKLKALSADDWVALEEGREIADGVTLESLPHISADRLGRVLAQATHAERHATKKLAAAYKHIEQLDAENAVLRARADWYGALPLSVTEARQDGVACGEFAQECLVRMEALYRTVLVRGDLSHEQTLREAQLRAGLIPLHTAVLGIAAGAMALARAMQDQVGEFLPADYSAELALSQEECAAIAEKRHYMTTHLDDLPSEQRLRNEAVQARAQKLQSRRAGRKRRATGGPGNG